MVTENNNNKYYEMIPNGDNFTVKYGRVGASAQIASYPSNQFQKKYNEKIKKGYVDQTELRKDLVSVDNPKEKQLYKEIENDSVKQLVEFLQKCARQKIADNYTVSSEKVTQAMVDAGQEILNEIDNLVRNINNSASDLTRDVLSVDDKDMSGNVEYTIEYITE